ncbi:protein Loquacious-like [Prorops nasuta]|uniref:protein Loquacious-like n=1 Tax=Prorops nasuta TaxID=863751 RepID=UPI0034D0058C
MNKTPVSILQEMMVKKGDTPNYELIHDGGGTHDNTFTFKVMCDNLSATGTGRCKRDAKQEAAKAMLAAISAQQNILRLPATPSESPITPPSPEPKSSLSKVSGNPPFLNAIGALKDLCVRNNLKEPEYQLTSEIGPPHAKVFSIDCLVSTFKEEGVAHTKKLAKQKAAGKMYDKILELVNDEEMNDTEDNESEINNLNDIAVAQYPRLSQIHPTKKTNLGIVINEYHVNFKNSLVEQERCSFIETLNNLLDRDYCDEETLDEAIHELQENLKSLNYKLIVFTVDPESKSDHNIVVMKVNCDPDILEVGSGDTALSAARNAITRLLRTMLLLLQ